MDGDVVILLIGDELLSGRTRDANGHFLAGRLDAWGYRVRRIVVLPDVDAEIRAAVREGLARAPWVILSGGLGSTHDDRTSVALAAEWGVDLVLDEEGWARMRARYEKRFGDLAALPPDQLEAARKMVLVPEGARVLRNPVGAASGYVLERGGGRVVVLPGVPAELASMFAEEVEGAVLPQRTPDAVLELEVTIPEAAFAKRLRDVADAFPDVSVGSYPHVGGLHVTLRFRGTEPRARAAYDRARELILGRTDEAGSK